MALCESTESSIDVLVSDESRQALDFWHTWRGDRLMPSWTTFDLRVVPPLVLPRTMVVDVLSDPTDFRYRFFGTFQVTTHATNMTGRSISEYEQGDYRQQLHEQYNSVSITKEPAVYFMSVQREGRYDYRSETVRLPLSEDGTTISQIFSVETEVEVNQSVDNAETQEILHQVFR